MKARFTKLALFVLLGIFIGMYFPRCGNDAGIGSDFDATKYYTKNDIDQMMSDYYTQSEVDQMMADYYTQLETDILLNQHYLKTDIDTMLTQYYQQSEVDTLVSKNKSSIISSYIASVGPSTTLWFLYGDRSDVIEYVSFIVPVNGTLTNLCVKPNLVPATGSICVITVLVNYSATSLQVTYESTDGTTLKVGSDVVTVNQGDIITLQISETNGVDPTVTFHVGFLFDAEG